jgi:hypothetical protein
MDFADDLTLEPRLTSHPDECFRQSGHIAQRLAFLKSSAAKKNKLAASARWSNHDWRQLSEAHAAQLTGYVETPLRAARVGVIDLEWLRQ